MNPLLIIVPIVWLVGWITAARHDAKVKKESTIEENVLAPRPLFFNDPTDDSDENIRRINEVRELHKFIKALYPDCEIWIGPKPPEIGYERVPFTWRSSFVWIKRPPVSDRRKFVNPNVREAA
jgi:hypothetical protein